jgi:1,3-beta-galactosyl-N-acetylhexosamine phosphorylase
MAKYKNGRVTLPTDKNMDEKILEIRELWGADAIRNSDGTSLSEDVTRHFEHIYATYLTTRTDLGWGKLHPEELSQIYLMTPHTTAVTETLEIYLLKSYYEEQVSINKLEDPARWWEVIDRTTGEVLTPEHWSWDFDKGTVTIKAEKWHVYTVTFLAFQIWDAVCMYNHLTNNWGDKPHDMPYDVYNPLTREHVLLFLRDWLRDNPRPDVVRFTTFFYQFTLIYDDRQREKFVDWFGYSGSVNPRLLEDFEKEYGYRLRPEDIVKQGWHNGSFCVPTKQYLDYMDFVQRFVTKLTKRCVDLVHVAGKKAMMFFGDHWIGAEPYGRYWGEIGLDAIVGSVGDGVTCRMIADVPNVKCREGRFLPYFFPDTFRPGGDPTAEANANWLAARRSICRSPLDRIGYGGYLGLATQFPDFVARVAEICDEFREIHDKIGGTKPYTPKFKVAILNSWGKTRRWQTTMVAHAKTYKQFYPYIGIVEALCGMPLDVDFISFDEIREGGVPGDVRVLLNYGMAGSAWSGGENWLDTKLLAAVRGFVNSGGGFIGIGEPSAILHQGRFFQLADVLGVDKELGMTLIYTKYTEQHNEPHFIMEGLCGKFDFGGGADDVYAINDDTASLVVENGCVKVAANSFGNGRAVYISGLPYNARNTRLLLRSIYWAGGIESELKKSWFSENINTECNAYPESGWWCVLNNSYETQKTVVYKGDGSNVSVNLAPMEIKWFPV